MYSDQKESIAVPADAGIRKKIFELVTMVLIISNEESEDMKILKDFGLMIKVLRKQLKSSK